MQYAVTLTVNAESTPKSWKAAFSAAASISACVDCPTLHVNDIMYIQSEAVAAIKLYMGFRQHRMYSSCTIGLPAGQHWGQHH